MSVLFALIFISVIALVLAVMIFILLRRISTLQGNDPERPDPRIVRYEESTRLLLEETRRQYERQISMLEQRLASREAEIEQRLERRSADLRRQSALEFSDLADEALRRESENLQNANRNDIDEILSPLRERIEEFRRAVSDSYIKENAQRTALSRQIETLVRANTEIGNEARRLSNALRGDTRLQGRWGETVLQRLLEQGGMIAGVHFSTQTASLDGKDLKSDDDGRGFRPDTIILLPGGHKIVVDAKTSMTDYLEYCDTTDPKEADACLRRHAASVRKHIKELADKQYHKLIDGALEHSLMFMPNDASYLAAIRADSALCEYALRNNVAIVAPAHMLSVVQLIAQLWRVENQNRNAEAIAEAGGKLYDKVASFLDEFGKIQKNIQLAQRAYDSSLRQLTSGSASITARAERLRSMGAKVSRRIPQHLVDSPVEEGDVHADSAEADGHDVSAGETGSREV